MLLATTMVLPAQWTEVGDAGSLPATAQVPTGTIVPLPSIAGNLSVGDVDMYLIEIPDPSLFSATAIGGTTIDTQLWLFFPDGRGVTFDDISPSGPVQSTITGVHVPFPGSYYLAISTYDIDAMASHYAIWNDHPYNVERRPDGPRRFEPVDAWAGPGSSGAYTITLTGVTRPGKEVVLPDSHHLTESSNQVGATGSRSWWRSGGGRFQILYEASHFASAGTNGPAWLDKLLFRGEDGEPNLGGQSWAGVVVRLATTPMAAGMLTADFANNLAAATNMSPPATFNIVAVEPSIGATPNNYNIGLNLYNSIGGYLYHPGNGNLLIDVTLPNAAALPPAAGPVMEMQDTSGTAAVVRGAGLTSPDPAAATGTLSASPPVVAFKIAGPGGSSPPVPARNEYYGAACGGSASSFYEGFLTGQPFDLLGLTLIPDNPAAPNFYHVMAGAPAFDPAQVNAVPDSIEDSGVVPFALGFTFQYPGGSTSQIRATTDGFVWLNGLVGGADYSPTVGELLGVTADMPARLAPFWYDFQAGHNVATHANSGLHVLTTGAAPNRICYVTWYHVGVFDSVYSVGGGGHAVHDMQLAIFETSNRVEFRYGSMPVYCSNNEAENPSHAGIVGFSRGRMPIIGPSVDPQSRDLSVEVGFQTLLEGVAGNIGQRVVTTPDGGGIAYGGRLFPGQTVTFDAVGVPPGAILGAQLLSAEASRPGPSLLGIFAPGCVGSVTLDPVIHELRLLPPAHVVGAVPIVVPPGIDGFELYAQYVVLDGLFGAADLVTAASNAVKLRVGRD